MIRSSWTCPVHLADSNPCTSLDDIYKHFVCKKSSPHTRPSTTEIECILKDTCPETVDAAGGHTKLWKMRNSPSTIKHHITRRHAHGYSRCEKCGEQISWVYVKKHADEWRSCRRPHLLHEQLAVPQQFLWRASRSRSSFPNLWHIRTSTTGWK